MVGTGTVIGKAEGPTRTSEYDGTSIIATVKKLFGLPNVQCVANSLIIGHLLI